jgi:carbon monoxide dehydrogenase subunit G
MVLGSCMEEQGVCHVAFSSVRVRFDYRYVFVHINKLARVYSVRQSGCRMKISFHDAHSPYCVQSS